jgi:AcrR family transcriptional regulator
MPNLPRALSALKQLAHLLDSVSLAGGAPTRYERLTNEYQAALEDAYQSWARWLIRQLNDAADDADRKQQIATSADGLLKTLQRIGNEHLPYAVNAIGVAEYAPSPDAWRMIAQAIESQNADFEARLIPYVIDTLQRGIDEQTDLRAVAESLTPRVAFYAGNLWVVIQKLVGDFAQQAATRDDLIYRCRWVRTQDDASCQSCIEFECEYDSYEAMLQATNQCVPGYFETSPYRSCFWNCRCWIELLINGRWTRI